MPLNICKETGHLARSCMFSWLRAEPVRPAETDYARVIDVEGLFSPPHNPETPPVPEVIPPLPSFQVPPSQPDETDQREQDKTSNSTSNTTLTTTDRF